MWPNPRIGLFTCWYHGRKGQPWSVRCHQLHNHFNTGYDTTSSTFKIEIIEIYILVSFKFYYYYQYSIYPELLKSSRVQESMPCHVTQYINKEVKVEPVFLSSTFQASLVTVQIVKYYSCLPT